MFMSYFWNESPVSKPQLTEIKLYSLQNVTGTAGLNLTCLQIVAEEGNIESSFLQR